MSEREIIWAVYTNMDLTEGRGREYIRDFCAIQATARCLAKKGYVQGSDCPVKPVEVLVLEGQRVLPYHIINVVPPSKEDLVTQAVIDAQEAAIAKAKAAGLTDTDIAYLQGRSP